MYETYVVCVMYVYGTSIVFTVMNENIYFCGQSAKKREKISKQIN